jgi:tetratricopeptide (TPR) repeat protein
LKYFSQIEENLPRSNAAVKHVKKNIRNIIARDFREEGFKFISEKQYSEAIISFKKALNIDPVDSLSLSGEALSRYWLGLKDEAFEKAKEAASLGEDSELTIVNVIFICLNTGNVDKAVAIGEKFMNSKIVSISRPEFYYNLGYAYVHAGKIDEAVTCLNRAIRMDEDFVFSYNNLGCAFWSKKDYAQAMRMFQKAVSLYPSYADAYFNLGVVYFQLGKLEDAYKEFQLALDAKPNFKDAGKFMNKIEAALNYKPSDLSIEPIEEPQSPQEKIQ